MNTLPPETDQSGPSPETWSGRFDPRLMTLLRQNNVLAEMVDAGTARFRSVPISELRQGYHTVSTVPSNGTAAGK